MNQSITIEQVSGCFPNKVTQRVNSNNGNFIWQIRFNNPLNPNTINDNTCYITNADSSVITTKLRYIRDKYCIEIAPFFAYVKDQSYTLHITKKVTSLRGKALPQEIQVRFHI